MSLTQHESALTPPILLRFAAYNEALRVSNQMTQNLQSDGAGHERIIARAQILYCTAFAAHVYSMMVYRLVSDLWPGSRERLN